MEGHIGQYRPPCDEIKCCERPILFPYMKESRGNKDLSKQGKRAMGIPGYAPAFTRDSGHGSQHITAQCQSL